VFFRFRAPPYKAGDGFVVFCDENARGFRPRDRSTFLAYCLYVTRRQRLRTLAPGLTPRVVMEKMCSLQMVDVRVPTTDGRLLILPRYTQPEKEHRMLLHQLRLQLPAQPTPKIIQQGAKYVAEVKTL